MTNEQKYLYAPQFNTSGLRHIAIVEAEGRGAREGFRRGFIFGCTFIGVVSALIGFGHYVLAHRWVLP